ncbi:MAG TPA: M1 family metallopeptidase [Flavobacteriales bacterium]|nr:M1 family metallopeptidase [Flavobacteriales bacterium]
MIHKNTQNFLRLSLSALLLQAAVNTGFSQNIHNNPTSNHGNKFEQLGTILGDINGYRSSSGAPGPQYWQQKADYVINARIDESTKTLYGEETVTYTNNSPEELSYLWLQLDENQHDPKSDNQMFDPGTVEAPYTNTGLDGLWNKEHHEGMGDKIEWVTDGSNKPLKYTINQTMMRVDLPKPLKPKGKFVFKVKWHYKMSDRNKTGGRGGYEHFDKDGNDLFTITQWYPRMCVYSDYQGWINKQFTGRGEFTLTFGNFDVSMTVPADHFVISTGVCQNYKQTLTPEQLARWTKAQTSKEPVEIVTLDEAKKREAAPEKNKNVTWKFKAENVRDFAWGSSRKFIWDAMKINVSGKDVMCMSAYPKEAYNLYRRYSTKIVAHTIRTYSKYTINYPYPTAISVEASNGMEYPMISFNYGRCNEKGNYTEGTKNGMIGVIIHEVGHNFFPMIINSDERQWSWMDEGLNTFVQFLTEQELDDNFPSSRGPAHKIVDYMSLPKDQLEPIMTNSENIIGFGPNAYGKPATGLCILRETIMGRELFDFAFKEYCRRWAFKHPTPSDLFRTMEDASGVDLDWFWRAWFYDIEPCEISLDSVRAFTVGGVKEVTYKYDTTYAKVRDTKPEFDYVTKVRNRAENIPVYVKQDTTLQDAIYKNNLIKNKPVEKPKPEVTKTPAGIEGITDSIADFYEDHFYYTLHFTNKGGMVMPIIIGWVYEDGSVEVDRISAYIWRKNENNFSKSFAKPKKVTQIILDPFLETADINTDNNLWKFDGKMKTYPLYKSPEGSGRKKRR